MSKSKTILDMNSVAGDDADEI
jgi:inositol hexakisphosphate/diphosphoinositol-pentakisphosphate kinase